MNTLDTGPSIKSYKKLNLWFDFSKSNILQIYSGKVDIGQHISSTLALICSQITGVNYNQIEVIKLDKDRKYYTAHFPITIYRSKSPRLSVPAK